MKPQLRFSEFTSPWRVEKIGNLLKIGSGRDYKHLSRGDVPVYGTGGLMLYVNDYLHDGKSIGIGRKGTIDKPQFIQGKFWTVDTLFYTHDYQDVVPEFMYTIFQNINWRKWNEASGVPSLSKATIEGIEVVIPGVHEQEKIAEFLTIIDRKIEVAGVRLKRLREYKKGVTQKLFSRQIRFTDIDKKSYPDWTEKKLSEILQEGSKVPVGDTRQYKKITVALNKKGVRLAHISREMADTRPFYIRKAGEIIIGKQNYFNGSVAIVPNELSGSICSNALMSFEVTKPNCSRFIYELISTPDFLRKREVLANGTGQKELSEKDFLNFQVLLPTGDEQQKIATLLTALDDRIEAERARLNAIKQWKKGLLQRMFI